MTISRENSFEKEFDRDEDQIFIFREFAEALTPTLPQRDRAEIHGHGFVGSGAAFNENPRQRSLAGGRVGDFAYLQESLQISIPKEHGLMSDIRTGSISIAFHATQYAMFGVEAACRYVDVLAFDAKLRASLLLRPIAGV